MDPVTIFQIQVLRAWKAGELKAKQKVRLYEQLMKNENARGESGLKYARDHARSEVKLYRRLIASALRKARSTRKAK